MKSDQIFQKYYGRLKKRGIIKALICGAAVGFAANFAVAFGFWFSILHGLWISLGVLAGVWAATTPVFYFAKFRPTSRMIAKELDRLGLEERIITMMELRNDESYIAMCQREDAKEKLKAVDSRRIKLAVSRASIILLVISFVFGCGMTVVTGLSDYGKARGGKDITNEIIDSFKPDVYYTIRYAVYEDVGGMIEGNDDQLVLAGEQGEEVFAEPEDDWYFAGWLNDAVMEKTESYPNRTDVAEVDKESLAALKDGEIEYCLSVDGGEVTLDEDNNVIITFYALFKEIDGSGDGEPGDGEPGDEEDKPGDAPEDGGENKPGDEKPNNPGDGNGDGIGGKDDPKDQVVDGEQNYKDRLDEFYQKYLEMMESGEEIPEDLKRLVEYYYEILK